MEGILESVKSLAAYLLFITVVKNLLGNSSYKKYAEFFMGLILILLIIKPLTQLLSLDETIETYLEKNAIQWDYQEVENQLRTAEEKRDQEIWNDYEKILKQQAQKTVTEQNLHLNKAQFTMSQEPDTYGQVKTVTLWVSSEEEPGIQVEKITLTQDDPLDTQETRKIKKKLSEEFQIQQSAIELYQY